MELFKDIERRDPAELLPATLPDPINFESQREFVRQTLENEVDLRAFGTAIHPGRPGGRAMRRRRAIARQLNSEGSPSEIIAAGYRGCREPSLSRERARPSTAPEGGFMSNPKEPTDVGRNRTGIGTSPIDSKAAVEGARAGTPVPQFEAARAHRHARRAESSGGARRQHAAAADIEGDGQGGDGRRSGKAPDGVHRSDWRAAGVRADRDAPLRCAARQVRGRRTNTRVGRTREDLERIRDRRIAALRAC